MSQPETEKPPKSIKPGFTLLLRAVVGIAIVGGGGAAAAVYFVGGKAHAADAEVAVDRPELVPRDGASAAAVAAATTRARTGRPDPKVFKASYIALEEDFTSNLAGGETFAQIGLGLSTYYDEKVVERVETHRMAIRSAVLMTLSQADPQAITTLAGKQALKRDLTAAINQVLIGREGFGGIDDVYFTSFVTQ